MEAVYDLLDDIRELTKISTCGDKGILRQEPKPLEFLDAFRTHLLASVEYGHWREPSIEIRTQFRHLSCFLLGLRRKVFDVHSGKILPYPDAEAFRMLYQVGCIYEKYGCADVTDAMKDAAIVQYHADEQRVADTSLEEIAETIKLANQLINRHFMRYYDPHGESPRHGPGVVSEGWKTLRQKYQFAPFEGMDVHWPQLRLENPTKRNFFGYLEHPRTSRMCFVPKNRKKCRVICAEPAALQYVQQGIRRPLYRAIEVSAVSIDLRDQSTNQRVALESSGHGYYATLDLRSASDLLSYDLVAGLFPWTAFARFAACRSDATWIGHRGDLTRVELKKFGSMGNALTFPVQSLAFWGLTAAVRMQSGDSESEATADTWVYGDDIVCPSHHYAAVADVLDKAGLKVNSDKSFSRGQFRESCGMHAFNGVPVTPAYVRGECHNPEGIASCIAAARLFHASGFNSTAEGLYRKAEAAIGEQLPVSRCAAGFARFTFSESICDAVKENQDRGHRVRNGSIRGIPEVRAKFIKPMADIFAAFQCSWDMWDFRGPFASTAERDRGIVASGKRLAYGWLPLAEVS